MRTIAGIAAAGMIAVCVSPGAGAADEHHHAQAQGAEAAASAPMAEGEIRKVDREAGKITIKHGPIANLDMPPMTMAFRVRDAALLGQWKPGDKIRFVADRINGLYVVLRIEAVK